MGMRVLSQLKILNAQQVRLLHHFFRARIRPALTNMTEKGNHHFLNTEPKFAHNQPTIRKIMLHSKDGLSNVLSIQQVKVVVLSPEETTGAERSLPSITTFISVHIQEDLQFHIFLLQPPNLQQIQMNTFFITLAM